MIKATIYRDRDKNIRRYIVKGHANFDEYGRDIVCAAASVLTQNTLISLVELLDMEELVDYKVDSKTGFLDVSMRPEISDEKLKEAQILLKSLEIGLREIVESYPEYMTLEYKGV